MHTLYDRRAVHKRHQMELLSKLVVSDFWACIPALGSMGLCEDRLLGPGVAACREKRSGVLSDGKTWRAWRGRLWKFG